LCKELAKKKHAGVSLCKTGFPLTWWQYNWELQVKQISQTTFQVPNHGARRIESFTKQNSANSQIFNSTPVQLRALPKQKLCNFPSLQHSSASTIWELHWNKNSATSQVFNIVTTDIVDSFTKQTAWKIIPKCRKMLLYLQLLSCLFKLQTLVSNMLPLICFSPYVQTYIHTYIHTYISWLLHSAKWSFGCNSNPKLKGWVEDSTKDLATGKGDWWWWCRHTRRGWKGT
jgi:hypothetical protein